jgi:hypothetical protein
MNYYEINRYCSPKSLLVITPKGTLIRIYCPFQVQCIEQVEQLNEFGLYMVNSVLMTEVGVIVYVIDNNSYHYHNFLICAER